MQTPLEHRSIVKQGCEKFNSIWKSSIQFNCQSKFNRSPADRPGQCRGFNTTGLSFQQKHYNRPQWALPRVARLPPCLTSTISVSTKDFQHSSALLTLQKVRQGCFQRLSGPSGPGRIFGCYNVGIWRRLSILLLNHETIRAKSFMGFRRHFVTSALIFSRFWLITAGWTVLVATTAANKSEGCPPSATTRRTTSGSGFGFEKKTFFSKKNIFLFQGKTKKTRQQHI